MKVHWQTTEINSPNKRVGGIFKCLQDNWQIGSVYLEYGINQYKLIAICKIVHQFIIIKKVLIRHQSLSIM